MAGRRPVSTFIQTRSNAAGPRQRVRVSRGAETQASNLIMSVLHLDGKRLSAVAER